MKQNNRRLWRRGDIALILSLLAAALLFILLFARKPESGVTARIQYKQETAMTLSLDNDRRFYINELPQVVFEVRGGQIAFAQSDCPDQVCVNTGLIWRAGQTAACLPNRVALVIEGGDGLDAVVR